MSNENTTQHFEPRDISDNLDMKYKNHSALIFYKAIMRFSDSVNKEKENVELLAETGIDLNKLAQDSVIVEFLPKKLLKNKPANDTEYDIEEKQTIVRAKYMDLQEAINDYISRLKWYQFSKKELLENLLKEISSVSSKMDRGTLTENSDDINAVELEPLKGKNDENQIPSVIDSKEGGKKKKQAVIDKPLSNAELEEQDRLHIEKENQEGRNASEARRENALKEYKTKLGGYKAKIAELEEKIFEAQGLKFPDLQDELLNENGNIEEIKHNVSRFKAAYKNLQTELKEIEEIKKQYGDSGSVDDKKLSISEIEKNRQEIEIWIKQINSSIETMRKAATDLSKVLTKVLEERKQAGEELTTAIQDTKTEEERATKAIRTTRDEMSNINIKIEETQEILKQKADKILKIEALKKSAESLKESSEKLVEWQTAKESEFRKTKLSPAIENLRKQIREETKLNWIEKIIAVFGGETHEKRQAKHPLTSCLDNLEKINEQKSLSDFEADMQKFIEIPKNQHFLDEFKTASQIDLKKLYDDSVIEEHKTAKGNYEKLIQNYETQLKETQEQHTEHQEKLTDLQNRLKTSQETMSDQTARLADNVKEIEGMKKLQEKVNPMSWKEQPVKL